MVSSYSWFQLKLVHLQFWKYIPIKLMECPEEWGITFFVQDTHFVQICSQNIDILRVTPLPNHEKQIRLAF